MKKIKISLSIMAVVVAAAATYANRMDTFEDGWRYIVATDECLVVTDLCTPNGNKPCQVSGAPVGNSSIPTSSTACGTQKKMP